MWFYVLYTVYRSTSGVCGLKVSIDYIITILTARFYSEHGFPLMEARDVVSAINILKSIGLVERDGDYVWIRCEVDGHVKNIVEKYLSEDRYVRHICVLIDRVVESPRREHYTTTLEFDFRCMLDTSMKIIMRTITDLVYRGFTVWMRKEGENIVLDLEHGGKSLTIIMKVSNKVKMWITVKNYNRDIFTQFIRLLMKYAKKLHAEPRCRCISITT